MNQNATESTTKMIFFNPSESLPFTVVEKLLEKGCEIFLLSHLSEQVQFFCENWHDQQFKITHVDISAMSDISQWLDGISEFNALIYYFDLTGSKDLLLYDEMEVEKMSSDFITYVQMLQHCFNILSNNSLANITHLIHQDEKESAYNEMRFGAIKAMTAALAKEWQNKEIRINTVSGCGLDSNEKNLSICAEIIYTLAANPSMLISGQSITLP